LGPEGVDTTVEYRIDLPPLFTAPAGGRDPVRGAFVGSDLRGTRTDEEEEEVPAGVERPASSDNEDDEEELFDAKLTFLLPEVRALFVAPSVVIRCGRLFFAIRAMMKMVILLQERDLAGQS
jgi:hypothetical protein